jgi:AraC-like DNA-binding protein
LFKAIELPGGGLGVTRTAMELGYGSTSAFVYAFRLDMGCSPQAHDGRGAGRQRYLDLRPAAGDGDRMIENVRRIATPGLPG